MFEEAPVLYAFGFDRICIVVGDLYFQDPNPTPGQEGPERGVRLELRLLERQDLRGSIYSATPISVDRPIWRADLLESVAGRPGSFDRTHHHPGFKGWEPGRRNFVDELSADPLGWLAKRLCDLDSILEEAGLPPDTASPGEAEELSRATPEIVDAVSRLLDRVRSGQTEAPADPPDPGVLARVGWL